MFEINNGRLIRYNPEKGESIVYIPGGVCSIDRDAFTNCDKISTIVFSSSVRSVSQDAFLNCPNLDSLVLNEGLTSFSFGRGPSPISKCPKLVSLELPTTIQTCSLRDAPVEVVSFREGTTTISEDFAGQGNFNRVNTIFLPKTLKSIGTGAFMNCTSLHTVHMYADLEVLPKSLFMGCSKLRNFTIPQSVRTIGASCFFRTALQSIAIPEGVKVLEDGTFQSCENLRKVLLPDSLEEIHRSVFSLSGIEEIRIPKNVKIVGGHNLLNDNLKCMTVCSPNTRFVTYVDKEYLNLKSEGWDMPSEWKYLKMLMVFGYAILSFFINFGYLFLGGVFYFIYYCIKIEKKYSLTIWKKEDAKRIWDLTFRRPWYERVSTIRHDDPNLADCFKP